MIFETVCTNCKYPGCKVIEVTVTSTALFAEPNIVYCLLKS